VGAIRHRAWRLAAVFFLASPSSSGLPSAPSAAGSSPFSNAACTVGSSHASSADVGAATAAAIDTVLHDGRRHLPAPPPRNPSLSQPFTLPHRCFLRPFRRLPAPPAPPTQGAFTSSIWLARAHRRPFEIPAYSLWLLRSPDGTIPSLTGARTR